MNNAVDIALNQDEAIQKELGQSAFPEAKQHQHARLQGIADKNHYKKLVIRMRVEDYSKLQSISDSTFIPLPIICRSLLKQAVLRYSSTKGPDNQSVRLNTPVDSLSKRELVILDLLVKGMSNKDIAERLVLKEQTVKNHVRSIFAKMKVNSRIKAALLAVKFL